MKWKSFIDVCAFQALIRGNDLKADAGSCKFYYLPPLYGLRGFMKLQTSEAVKHQNTTKNISKSDEFLQQTSKTNSPSGNHAPLCPQWQLARSFFPPKPSNVFEHLNIFAVASTQRVPASKFCLSTNYC